MTKVSNTLDSEQIAMACASMDKEYCVTDQYMGRVVGIIVKVKG